jgi:hypothetical protein
MEKEKQLRGQCMSSALAIETIQKRIIRRRFKKQWIFEGLGEPRGEGCLAGTDGSFDSNISG